MAKDPETLAHLEWLGYVQPVGLVVSIPAMLAAQAIVNRNIAPQHALFLECLPRDTDGEIIPELRDFASFTQNVLNWRASDLESVKPGDEQYLPLEVHLPVYHETLRPTHVVRELNPKYASHPWMLLIQQHPAGTNFDKACEAEGTHWVATPQAKFERLLRESNVPIGLLVSPSQIRLVSAPRGESSGFMTFSIAEMVQVAGRPIFAALHMLLSDDRLFTLGEKQRLPAILSDSRKYQNHVSNELAQQVLAALYELLRGFQAADDAAKGDLLRTVLASDPNHVYGGLLTVLMRLVFVLYAEDRNLISNDPVYSNFYSVTGLFERLRADVGRYPDTMDHRYGAWAQLLTLFRLVYHGGSHGNLKIPARKGYLFDPDRYLFLEGRTTDEVNVPRIPDGVIFRVLKNLLILDGERLSYRALDVEQIGSVYEAMMGFRVEVAKGRSIAIKPKKTHGAPVTINLDALLAEPGDKRAKWFIEQVDLKLTAKETADLKLAKTPEDAVLAFAGKQAKAVTPNIVPSGSMVLQPSDERRRSGSHYTPRSLTEPIVRKALEPVLKQFGDNPKPSQILDLKICDPAMGSGAFLVEACRQLGEVLVKAWHAHNQLPKIPPDEDELLHAQRLIAQRCLYGVDKNPMAVDLAKLSLWLVTLAMEHPFTFVDHTLRCGDSLVGLTLKQIKDFHWLSIKNQTMPFGQDVIIDRIKSATAYRQKILDAGDTLLPGMKEHQLKLADEALNLVRFAGNLVIAAFFAADKDKARIANRDEYLSLLSEYLRTGNMTLRPTKQEAALLTGDKAILPFHWEIEFPEVFGKKECGFDCIVGNPPFAGKNTIGDGNRPGFLDWLKALHEESHGNADLVAHFFRRAFNLLRKDGTFGLIATNTIAQGDTRSSGLRWICTHGGTIYYAKRRYKWPGQAAVIVSVVHIAKCALLKPYELDDREVHKITAYLFHAGGHDDPAQLAMNRGRSFAGSVLLGMGFSFDNSNSDGAANPISLMQELIAKDKRNAERIFPYYGGEEVNESPTHAHQRYVISFGEMKEEQARQWPDLIKIVEEKVKPERLKQKRESRSRYWWRYGESAPAMYEAIKDLDRVLVTSYVGQHTSFTFVPNGGIYAITLAVLAFEQSAAFCLVQSRLHQIWVRFLASSFKDDLRYTPSDCFETFPFPSNFEQHPALEAIGQEYYECRAALMVKHNEGLTKTYNRFHDPHETNPDILMLRDLHDQMDRAVLQAYGPPFADLVVPKCEFLLDYEEQDDDEEETTGKRQKKKPWRYRWPDTFRDEVLALLLELNKQRAEAEKLSGAAAEEGKRGRTRARTNRNDSKPGLF